MVALMSLSLSLSCPSLFFLSSFLTYSLSSQIRLSYLLSKGDSDYWTTGSPSCAFFRCALWWAQAELGILHRWPKVGNHVALAGSILEVSSCNTFLNCLEKRVHIYLENLFYVVKCLNKKRVSASNVMTKVRK